MLGQAWTSMAVSTPGPSHRQWGSMGRFIWLGWVSLKAALDMSLSQSLAEDEICWDLGDLSCRRTTDAKRYEAHMRLVFHDISCLLSRSGSWNKLLHSQIASQEREFYFAATLSSIWAVWLQAIAALKTLGSARAMELFKDVEESWQVWFPFVSIRSLGMDSRDTS